MGDRKRKFSEYKKLKTILFEKKISYDEIAKRIDLSKSAFSNKINGVVDFRIDEIAKICNELNVEYDIILDEKLRNSTNVYKYKN